MYLIIIGLIAYAIYEAIKSREARKAQAQAARIAAEQQRIRAEWMSAQQRAKAEAARMNAIERESVRLAREQARQAEQLRKHDEQIAKIEYRLSAAEGDIEHWKEQVSNLYALLDIEQMEQAGALPGSKTDLKCQKKIITLKNQIHAAENRLNKARYEKAFCQNQMVEVA
jgi:chromosome segregation ATPase